MNTSFFKNAKGEKIFLSFMSWAEVEEALENGKDMVFIPVGSNEQHGPHRPVGDDWIFATEYSLRTAQKMDDALVAPPICYGVAPYHMFKPGTVTLPRHLHTELIKNVVKSLWTHGFKRFVLINCHGGNALSTKIAQMELKEEIPEMKIVYGNPRRFHTKEYIENELNLPYEKYDSKHGGGFQTSCIMAIEKKYGLEPGDLCDKTKAPPYSRKIHILSSHLRDQVAGLPLSIDAMREYTPQGIMYERDDSNMEATMEDGEHYMETDSSHYAKKLKDPDTWLW